jgi:hypothetical protein
VLARASNFFFGRGRETVEMGGLGSGEETPSINERSLAAYAPNSIAKDRRPQPEWVSLLDAAERDGA